MSFLGNKKADEEDLKSALVPMEKEIDIARFAEDKEE